MYIQTRSKTITEATNQLMKLHFDDFVFYSDVDGLNEAQKTALYEYLEDIKQYTEDVKLALENLYVNLTNDHIYVLERADDGDDNVEYYYTELVPTITLYKDDLGNLYYYEGMTENGLAKLVLVEEDEGHYIYTHNTWYEDINRLAELYTKIEVEV